MGESAMGSPVPEQVPGDSFFNRAAGVFFSPARTFDSIAQRPDFLVPLIISIAGSVLLIEAMLAKVGSAAIIRRSLEISGRAAQMTPEQLDQAIRRGGMITSLILRAAAILGVPMFLLIIAATGLFIVNVIFGASANFKASFSVVCYANLVLQVAVILGLAMVWFGDPEQFNPENFVPTNVGFFLNPLETSKPLYVIASSFDVFRLWFVGLSSMGLSATTGKKVGTVAIFLTYLGIWIVLVLARAGMAALMG